MEIVLLLAGHIVAKMLNCYTVVGAACNLAGQAKYAERVMGAKVYGADVFVERFKDHVSFMPCNESCMTPSALVRVRVLRDEIAATANHPYLNFKSILAS